MPSWVQRVGWQLLLARLLILVGLAVSSALVADHVFEVGAFCGFDDPCRAVASSAYGEVVGVPLSVIGVVGFAGLFALTLVPARWAVGLLRILSAVAGLAGLALLVIQFAVLRQTCPLCLVVDTGSVALAVVLLVRRPAPVGGAWLAARVFGWSWAGLAAGLAPLFWAAAHLPAAAPEQVRAHWVSGKITMVAVSDFDCPHCQHAAPIVDAWLQKHPEVRFVRLVCPMTSVFNSWPPALAYLAAVRQGKGEEMARALYAAADRERHTCRRIAERVGLDMAAYDRDIADPALTAEAQRTAKWVKETDMGLPFFWIQDELVAGTPRPERLDRALERAQPAP